MEEGAMDGVREGRAIHQLLADGNSRIQYRKREDDVARFCLTNGFSSGPIKDASDEGNSRKG